MVLFDFLDDIRFKNCRKPMFLYEKSSDDLKIITIRESYHNRLLCPPRIQNLLFEYWNVVGDETFRTTGIRPNLFPSASSEFVRWWSLRNSDISIELHCLPRFDGLRRNCTASVSPSSMGNGRSYVRWRESNKWLRRFGWYNVCDWLNITK